MKILSIIIPNLEIGGAEKNAVTIANSFAEMGYEVRMVLMHAKGPLIKKLNNSVKIIDLKCNSYFLLFPKLLVYFFRNFPDAILVYMFPLTFFSALACKIVSPKTRVVLTERTTFSNQFFEKAHLNFLHKYATKILMNFIYPFADAVVLVSQQALSELKKFLYFKQHKINYSVIYNPIEMNKTIDLDGQDIIEKWGEGGAKKILAIGRLCYAKNYPQLIIAFAQIVKKYNVKLMILGDGPERKSLEILIYQYNLQDKVLMPGFITNTSLFYQNADLYILSSRTEGFPNVLLEALSFGLKIISTNCPSGPSEILEGGKYGTLVPVNDNHALAIAIEKALVEDNHHNPEKIKERIEAFRLEKTISEYRQVLFEK